MKKEEVKIMDGKFKIAKKRVEGAVASEHFEQILLCDSIFGDKHTEELQEINKHEIIVKIAEIIGTCPSNLKKAEDIFETIKYAITNYIIHHEYSHSKAVSTELLVWLDSKINPKHAEKLTDFISKYL